MKISKKINPSKLEESNENAARQAFIASVVEMRLLPPPQNIEFYIRINFQFAGDKTTDSCLLVLGEQTATWKATIKSELKADKKQVLIGLASISKDGKFLQLQIELGAAKKSIVRKGLKAWCNKVGLKLDFTGGEPDPEDVDTEEELNNKIDMQQSNITVKANEDAVLLAEVNASAVALQPKAAQLLAPSTSAEIKKQMAKELLAGIPPFLEQFKILANPLPKLIDFADKMNLLYTQLDIQVAEARFLQLSTRLDNLILQLNSNI